MKYGKEFQQILNESDFPDEWKSSAIEYGQLKKLIKDVVAELSSMGLSRDVLTRLLVTDEPDVSERAEGDVLEFEFESDSPEMQSGLGGQHAKLEPIDDEAPQVTPRRESTVAPIEQRKFRVRLLSNGQPAPPDHEEVRPMSVEAMMREQGVDAEHEHRTRRAVVDAQGAKAEYVLTGEPEHPIPQLRVHLSLTRSASPGKDDTEEDEPLDPSADFDIPPSPTLGRVRNAASPIWALTSGAGLSNGLDDLTIGDSATPAPPEKELVVPLTSDMAFFNLLTAALTSLSEFHAAQQELFRQSVENLCRLISQSIQPSSRDLEVLPVPLTPSADDSQERRITTSLMRRVPIAPGHKASKKDLYAWREIFTLWIESEIFESSAERSRGERTVEEAQERLKRFADLVVARGLGDRRTMRGKKVRAAWEEFLRLNVLLLDLKRFQTANINAARKILKKHDKRTALTASAGFQSFVRSSLSQVSDDGNGSWVFYNTSLPHVLLSSLTDTLLPILPSLDDYACLICTSIAFKPIRLNCGHLFCVRCLVKMQRAGKQECPLCRSQVVLLANKDSLDLAVMNFMKEWFPKEVKEKQKENQEEISREQMQLQSGGEKCVIM